MLPDPPPSSPPPQRARRLVVPPSASGMRLDMFLSRWFRDFSRSMLARGIKSGEVCCDGRALRSGSRVRGGQELRITIPGIAPDGEPPPFPPVLYEADGLVVVDKPAGMLCHPAGSSFTWALVGLARERYPEVELVHRLDRDTSGCIALTTTPQLNRHLKLAIKEGRTRKVCEAIVKGEIPWERMRMTGPIGPAGGVIRIQMAVRADGKSARTDVTVVQRRPGFTRVRCRIYSGRTHQIRVHLAHAGFPLLGDRMYGVDPEVFLHTLEGGADASTREASGAPHHALHASELELPLPGGPVVIRAPFPPTLTRWWEHPEQLPHDAHS